MLVLKTRIMELVKEEKFGEKGMSNTIERETRIEVRLQKVVFYRSKGETMELGLKENRKK